MHFFSSESVGNFFVKLSRLSGNLGNTSLTSSQVSLLMYFISNLKVWKTITIKECFLGQMQYHSHFPKVTAKAYEDHSSPFSNV